MDHPGKIHWHQTIIGGTRQDQWFAYLPSRGGACFASISLKVDGVTWNCNVFPQGKEPGARIHHFNTADLGKAKDWIERWATHHWPLVTELPSARPGIS